MVKRILNGELVLGGSSLLFPIVVYYAFPFLGNYINHQKDMIAYIPLDPVADYLYIADLNTRLRVGWKTRPD